MKHEVRAERMTDSEPRLVEARRVLKPEGIGVFQLNGAAAGQTVFHYHMHLIPRMRGDSLRIHGRRPGDESRLAEIAEQLGDALRSAAAD